MDDRDSELGVLTGKQAQLRLKLEPSSCIDALSLANTLIQPSLLHAAMIVPVPSHGHGHCHSAAISSVTQAPSQADNSY